MKTSVSPAFGRGHDDRPELLPGDVHLWTIALDRPANLVLPMRAILGAEEQARASRFVDGRLRDRYIVAHAALRQILGLYLESRPEEVQFSYSAYGKPSVEEELRFSLSHSDAIGLCALACRGHLGVDVERVRPIADAHSIVRRYFAPDEIRQYIVARECERTAMWFSAWTRKEAFLKATGEGMQRALDSFSVDMTPSETAPRLIVEGEPADRWHLRSFTPAPGYAGAVALDAPIERIEWFSFLEFLRASRPRTRGRRFGARP